MSFTINSEYGFRMQEAHLSSKERYKRHIDGMLWQIRKTRLEKYEKILNNERYTTMSKYLISDDLLMEWETTLRDGDKFTRGIVAESIDDIRKNWHQDNNETLEKLRLENMKLRKQIGIYKGVIKKIFDATSKIVVGL